ncbi:MAG: hypothetical protein GX442_13650 [Candidatus Riflebacteria bacterium]|nr:hypothetical protein [Candidatus Riflebacteria bacterium]
MKGMQKSPRLPLVAAFLLVAGMALSVMVEEHGIPVPVPGFDPAAVGTVFSRHAPESAGLAAGFHQGSALARPAAVNPAVPSTGPLPEMSPAGDGRRSGVPVSRGVRASSLSVERAQEVALRVAESRQAPPEPFDPADREDVLVYLSWKGDRYHSNPLCSNGTYVAVRRSEVPDRYTPCRRCCDE